MRSSLRCGLVVALFSLLGTGCGSLRLPLWLNIDPETSEGKLDLQGLEVDVDFSGGLYAILDLDTSQVLSGGGITGTVEVPLVRILAAPQALQGLIGNVCLYADPEVPLVGDIRLDPVTGEWDFDLPLRALAWSTALSPSLGAFAAELPTTDVTPTFDGKKLSDAILFTGDVDDAVAIPLDLQSTLDVPSIGEVLLDVVLDLRSGNVPTGLDPAGLDDCLPIIDAVAGPIPHHVPPRATFLRTHLDPEAAAPIVVELDQLGAEPGDTLRFTPTGSFKAGPLLQLSSGNAVFSGSDEIRGPVGRRHRVVDAIDAGQDVYSGWVAPFVPSNIPEDFGISGGGADVVVPEGASHLFLGINDLFYSDNSGLLFNVLIEKIPAPVTVVNGDMEDPSDVFDDGRGWETDAFSIVGAERGVVPRGGSSMLRFDATDGAAPGLGAANASQVVDVSDYAGTVDRGGVGFEASAFFNRVTGDAATDTGFLVFLIARDRAGSSLASSFAALFSDADPATWESLSASIELPVGTREVNVDLVAVENVSDDDAAPEFGGHYVDDVEVDLIE